MKDALDEALEILRQPKRIRIQTPWIAISINAAYRNAGSGKDGKKHGRIRTAEYKAWFDAFSWDAVAQSKPVRRIEGPYTIKITIDRASRHPLSDIMNREKVVSDALQELGVIANDNLCESGTVCWGSANGGMLIEIEEWRE